MNSGLLNRKIVPVSVVIPCYCGESTLARALRSIYMQSAVPSEVIVIDDGSPDRSAAAMTEICDTFNKIMPGKLLLHPIQSRQGPGNARNIGWDLATNKRIAFLDADDIWHPHKIEIQLSWMDRHRDSEMTCHKSIVASHERDIHRFTPRDGFAARKIAPLVQLLSNRVHTRTVMLNRRISYRFEATRKHSEDYQLWLEIILNDIPAYYLDVPLAYTFKAQYGGAGLSGDLFKMEVGELQSYRYILRNKLISAPLAISLFGLSLIKFAKRIVLRSVRQTLV